MATQQYTYAQVQNGFCGHLTLTGNQLALSANNAHSSGFFVAKVVGTEAKVKARDNGSMIEVSVDGSAFVSALNNSGVYTLFAGLSDQEHEILVRTNAAFGDFNGYFLTGGDYVLEVTGANPSFSVLPYYNTPIGSDLIYSTSTVSANAGANIDFRQSVATRIWNTTTMFQTDASELLFVTARQISNQEVGIMYSVNGGSPTYLPANDSGLYRLTNLTGNNVYNVWTGKDGANNANNLRAIQSDQPLVKVGARLDQFGDSITAVVDSIGNHRCEVYEVAAHFGLNAQCYATGGWTINSLLTNIPTFNLSNIVTQDDTAIVAVSRNDINDLTTNPTKKQEYKDIINLLLTAGYGKVLCRGILSEETNDYAPQNAILESAVTELANPLVEFIDVSSWVNIDTVDGVHPSLQGYQEMTAYAKVTYQPFLQDNQAPTADAGADQINIEAGATVILDGTGSTDTDGTIASYQWTQTAGDNVTLNTTNPAKPMFTAPTTANAQTLTFSLVVTDDDGAVSTNTTTVDIGVLAEVAQAISSTLDLTITGITDGSQALKLWSETTNELVFNGNATFLNENTLITLTDIPVGTAITGRWLGANPPTTGTGIYGVTE